MALRQVRNLWMRVQDRRGNLSEIGFGKVSNLFIFQAINFYSFQAAALLASAFGST